MFSHRQSSTSIASLIALLLTLSCADKNTVARRGIGDESNTSGEQQADAQGVNSEQSAVSPAAITGVNLVTATFNNSSLVCSLTSGGSGSGTGVHCYVNANINSITRPAEAKGPGFELDWNRIADKSGRVLSGLTPTLTLSGLRATYHFRPEDLASFDLSEIEVAATFHDNIKSLSRSSSTRIPGRVCPAGFVSVPANPAVGVPSSFCVMKFEAKNVDGKASSVPGNQPWERLPRGASGQTPGSAWKACQDMGNGFDLISNAQWQAIARNIESVSSNWSTSSTVGLNFINMGHSDSGPGVSLAAADDNDPCFGTEQQSCNNKSVPDFTQKRTHTLSNGEIIWDISGNLYEWTRDNVSAFPPNLVWVSQMTEPEYDLLKFGPSGDYTDRTSAPFGGLGTANNNTFAGPIHRGSGMNSGQNAGIFYVSFDRTEDVAIDIMGFRCVYK